MSDVFLQLSGNPYARKLVKSLGLPLPMPPQLPPGEGRLGAASARCQDGGGRRAGNAPHVGARQREGRRRFRGIQRHAR